MDRQLRVTDDVCEQHMRDLELNFFFNFGSHVLFRRGRGDQFLEARIISKRIEHRIEPEQRRSKRHVFRERAKAGFEEEATWATSDYADHGCFSSQSFWKAGSARKGSQIGSSLRRAGVMGVV